MLHQNLQERVFETYSGFGAHEVIIETPNHEKQIWDFDYNDFKLLYNYKRKSN